MGVLLRFSTMSNWYEFISLQHVMHSLPDHNTLDDASHWYGEDTAVVALKPAFTICNILLIWCLFYFFTLPFFVPGRKRSEKGPCQWVRKEWTNPQWKSWVVKVGVLGFVAMFFHFGKQKIGSQIDRHLPCFVLSRSSYPGKKEMLYQCPKLWGYMFFFASRYPISMSGWKILKETFKNFRWGESSSTEFEVNAKNAGKTNMNIFKSTRPSIHIF